MFVSHTKITVPQLPPEFVKRPSLRARLDSSDVASVGLVCAPAGYGKTLLLADWARAGAATDTAWVGLDRDDNDPRRLWASVVAAVAACPSVPATSRLRAPFTWRREAGPECLAEITDALQVLPGPIRLILDDVHELVEPETLYGLQTFLRSRPKPVQLVLASRLDPPLSLPRLRLAGRLWELRADRLRFSRTETAALLENSGLHLRPDQVDVLHRRTDGWVAGLRLAALALIETADPDGFLAEFSGDDRSVADYLVGEVLSHLPEDLREFLRVISISDPMPAALAAELSGRNEAGSLLDELEHRTGLVSATGRRRDAYRVQQLLRTYLLADLRRQGTTRSAELHTAAARWCARQGRTVPALDHAAQSRDTGLLSDLLHRHAVSLILTGDHGPLRRALATLGARATATDPLLALTSALINLERGELPAAGADLRRARQSWPDRDTPDLLVLRIVAEQLGAAVPGTGPPASAARSVDELPPEPELEALARLGRGTALLLENEARDAARDELEVALGLAREHGFAYLSLQCLVLLAIIAVNSGDFATMRAVAAQARTVAEPGWRSSSWSVTATAMLAYAALQSADAREAQRLAGEELDRAATACSPPLRFALRMVHGAAVFDQGDRPAGLGELQQARSELGEHPVGAEHAAAAALLEFRAALLLGHSAAARTVYEWLADRTDADAELQLMRAWKETAAGHHEPARATLQRVVDGQAETLLPHTLVDALLLETMLAALAGERPAARRALQNALALADRLDAVRSFAWAGPSVRELLIRQRGSFGTLDPFAERALAAGASGKHHRALLSERELTVLGLLPSLLSLEEIAEDLTVSVNTVKSHVRAIYTKLGVSSRRSAVLAAHEHGLLTSGAPSG